MSTTALFTVTQPWKQPRYPTTNEWTKKMWYLNTVDYYSATKKNEIMSLVGKWVEMEIIMLSEISQTQKAKCHLFLIICGT
jgi:hypothetical protein